MTIVEIPVSPFSKRIIESEHDLEHLPGFVAPIVLLQQSDILKFMHLEVQRSYKNPPVGLTESIYVRLNEKLAEKVCKNSAFIGDALNEYHREELYKTIWNETRTLRESDAKSALEAKTVIEKWCAYHQIQVDIDINYDTLYRGWTRFKKKKELKRANLQVKNTCPVRQKIRKKQAIHFIPTTHKYTVTELDLLAEKYIQQHPHLFAFKYTPNPRYAYIKAVKICIYYYIGGMTIPKIAKILKMKTSSLYANKIRFEKILHQYPLVF